jgi:glutathione S-transferase
MNSVKTIRFIHITHPSTDVSVPPGRRSIERMNMLKLYYSPAACSLAAHIALREAELPHQLKMVDLKRGEHLMPGYEQVHSLRKVPALKLEDGEILTEVSAILTYVALQCPQKQLLPTGSLPRVRAVEWMGLLSAAVHPSFWGFLVPGRFTKDEAAQMKIQGEAAPRFFEMLQHVEQRLSQGGAALTESSILLDAYTFVFYLWGLRLKLPVAELTEYTRLARRVASRQATRDALSAEGMSQLIEDLRDDALLAVSYFRLG